MKKKIIFILSFLVIAMCLAGCSTNVTREKVEEMTEIAQNIKDNLNYELPKGYTYENADNTKNDGRIVISCEDNVDTLSITFDISQNEVKYIAIKNDYDSVVSSIIVFAVIICVLVFIVGYLLGKNGK